MICSEFFSLGGGGVNIKRPLPFMFSIKIS